MPFYPGEEKMSEDEKPKLLTQLELKGAKGESIPVFVDVHERFTSRLRFVRSIEDLDAIGFKRPSAYATSGDMAPEGRIRIHAENALLGNYLLVGIGRANSDETAEQAEDAIFAYERLINR